MVDIELGQIINRGRTVNHDGDCSSTDNNKCREIGQVVRLKNGGIGLKFPDGRLEEIEGSDELEIFDSEFQV